MEPTQRLLPLVGAYNFRDLGGYPTSDGGMTRWGRLFRSDTLHELTESDLKILRDVGLRKVIDLRTATEVEETGRGLLENEPISYLHLSVIQQPSEPETPPAPLADIDLADVYVHWLDTARAALVPALCAVADPSSYPLVFHCAAGKDRTGVLAALALDIVGVDREVIVEDYVLTAGRMDLIRARQRIDPETAQRMIDAPQLFEVEARTMEVFLDAMSALLVVEGPGRP
jgi:protein-tyrosine phosphatase